MKDNANSQEASMNENKKGFFIRAKDFLSKSCKKIKGGLKWFFITVKNFFFNVIKKITIWFNNFPKTSLVIAITSLVSAITGGLFLAAYEFSGKYIKEIPIQLTAFSNPGYALGYDNYGDYTGGYFENGQILGMIFFLAAIISIIISIVVIYVSIAPIFNRELMLPKRSNVILACANGVFEIVMVALTLVLLTSPEYVSDFSHATFIICLVLGFINILASLFLIIPAVKCQFYMPPIKGAKK